MFECHDCGEIFERPAKKIIHNRRMFGHPEHDSPDDYLEICPFCRAVERFQEIED